ncbi:hypothetical protein FHG89_09005 [Micromonospora orduensis]|uniref:Uncharacterized protein n=1 Tax=Micromonospora orduensis TaxID=1420891 RepID=A0A5C4QW29_9ACTN|nr:hypothetical protein [Micromonospora orduensis]TNH30173.1 hypothetical protein FHG89_09005 [Micromonospora orduensis]
MRYLRIRSRHQPYEVAVLVTSPICGVLMLTLDVRPTSVQTSMPAPVQAAWELGLILVGVGGLLGILWPGRLSTGLGLELASVLVLGTITGMYAVALVSLWSQQSLVASSFVVAVTIGSIWRAIQIAVDLRRLVRACRCVTDLQLQGSIP